MEELKSQHSSPYSTLEESECSEFITKRKRKRVRKRNNSKPPNDLITETPASTSSNYSLNSTKSCTSLHVKFEYDNEDDDNIKIVNLKDDLSAENNTETIIITSDKDTSIINESTILKAPLMKDILPKTGDLIAFKVSNI